jgi:hypothetical protein
VFPSKFETSNIFSASDKGFFEEYLKPCIFEWSFRLAKCFYIAGLMIEDRYKVRVNPNSARCVVRLFGGEIGT